MSKKTTEGHWYEVPVEVRFKDVDAMGHVNNAVHVTYFEQGRAAFFRDVFGVWEISDINFLVVRMEVDYRRPVLLSDALRIQLRVAEVGRTSFTLEYRLLASGALAAEGRSVQVFYDYRKGIKKPVPASFLDKARAYMSGGGAPC